MYVYISWNLMQIPLKHHALFGFVNIVHGFLDGNTMFFYLHKTCQRRTHYSLISSCIVPKHLIRNVNEKNFDRKNHAWEDTRVPLLIQIFTHNGRCRGEELFRATHQHHPLQNWFCWGWSFCPQAPEFLKNHLILSGNARFAPFLLGMPRKITKITAMFDPGRIPKWQRKWSRVLRPEKWWYSPSLWTNNHFSPLKVGPSYPKRKPYRFPTNYLSGAKLFLWVGSFFLITLNSPNECVFFI